jgi:hypothetical protein
MRGRWPQTNSFCLHFPLTSSPTVALTSVFVVITIAAHNRWDVVTVDITGAYLNSPLNEDVFMRLDPYLTDILVEISDEYIPFIQVTSLSD